jgi:hypothetical protein
LRFLLQIILNVKTRSVYSALRARASKERSRAQRETTLDILHSPYRPFKPKKQDKNTKKSKKSGAPPFLKPKMGRATLLRCNNHTTSAPFCQVKTILKKALKAPIVSQKRERIRSSKEQPLFEQTANISFKKSVSNFNLRYFCQ